MNMIDLMQRLAELDAKNPNVVKEQGVGEAVRVMGRTGQGEPMQRLAKGAPGAEAHRSATAAMARQARAAGSTLATDRTVDVARSGKYPEKQVMKYQSKSVTPSSVTEGSDKKVVIKPETEQEMLDWLESEGFDAPEPTTDNNGNLVYDFTGDNRAYMYASEFDIGGEEADDLSEGVAESIDQSGLLQLMKTADMVQKTAGAQFPVGFSNELVNTLYPVFLELEKTPIGQEVVAELEPYRKEAKKYETVDQPYPRDYASSLQGLLSKAARVLDTIPQQGVAEGLNECGMMGGMSQPHSPASINMTADSGAELTGMLKDIMQLAGLKQVEPAHLGVEPMPAVVTAEPGISIADPDGHSSIMRSMMDKLNPATDESQEDDDEDYDAADAADRADYERRRREEEQVDEYDSTGASPHDHDMADDAMVRPSNQDPAGAPGAAVGRHLKNNPVATPMSTYESLMAEYQTYINEN